MPVFQKINCFYNFYFSYCR